MKLKQPLMLHISILLYTAVQLILRRVHTSILKIA